MNIQSIVKNELSEDEHSVWHLKEYTEFGYSDGAASEKYLRKVFSEAKDLSTHSFELENYIKDWPSEYHLTTKRAQLLSGFTFEPTMKALEVGCGCGAITRFLGETFNQVISVEGNINRAHLARQRSEDLDSVSVICAPFQEINFSEKFDIIFCIGVFEYSASFVEGDDPYDAVLDYFSNLLTPDGMVVIAIENQFGLKYFTHAREDHLGIKYEGLEGYHRHPGKVRTFGKVELEERLKKYFPQVEFFYPYPDYKIPECVISSEFLASRQAGELISQMHSRDYSGLERMLWDDAATTLELDKNNMLDFFAHSFLVFAGKQSLKAKHFDQSAILFSSGRKAEYSTQTKIFMESSGDIRVQKRRRTADENSASVEQAALKLVGSDSLWLPSQSLLTQVVLRAHSHQRVLEDIFEPCKIWLEFLKNKADFQNQVYWLEGTHIDSLWSNAYLVDGQCEIIDKEWVWDEKIRMNVVVIRAIYDFFSRIERTSLYSRALSIRNGRSMIKDIASNLGVQLENIDFDEFSRIESDIAWIVSGHEKKTQLFYIRWFLIDRPTRRFARKFLPVVKSLTARVQAKFFR